MIKRDASSRWQYLYFETLPEWLNVTKAAKGQIIHDGNSPMPFNKGRPQQRSELGDAEQGDEKEVGRWEILNLPHLAHCSSL